MGMFRKLKDKEDIPGGTNDDSLEEQYQKMFKKIARDFVFKEDLKLIFSSLFEELFDIEDEAEAERFNQYFTAAALKAIEYKDNLNKPLNKRKKYKDVIDDE
jgi:hypothetical protein